MKFYEIKDKHDAVEILFYGDIVMDNSAKWDDDDDARCPSDIIKALKEADGRDIEIRINSGGGSVFGGMAIYNVLKAYKGRKVVYVDGVAASIASVIMLCGDELHMPRNGYAMFHKPWGICMGNAKDMMQYIEGLDTCERGMMSIYEGAVKDGGDMASIRDAMTNGTEKWYTGEALAEVFNVIIEEPVDAVALMGDTMNQFDSMPQGITRARAEPEPEQQVKGGEGGALANGALESLKLFLYVENERNRR